MLLTNFKIITVLLKLIKLFVMINHTAKNNNFMENQVII